MTSLQYTDEQHRALETRESSVALDAGAGCGKTFVLTERFLSHLDPSRDDALPATLEELIAITFTDAAAREMRDRIRRRCRERLAAASPDDTPFWRRLLRSLDGARVSTIHAFCSGLVRSHAVELGIDPSFRVLDPPAAQVMRSEAVDDTLRARLLRPDGKPDETLVDLAADFGLQPLKSAVLKLADSAADPTFGTWRDRSPKEIVTAWREFYSRELAPAYLDRLLASPAISELRGLLPFATPVTPGFAERIKTLREVTSGQANLTDVSQTLKEINEAVASYIPGTRKAFHTAKDWPDQELKKKFTAACKTLRELMGKQKQPTNPDSLKRAAEAGLQIQRLAAEANTAYRNAKRAIGALDHDDLLNEARRLLTLEEFTAIRKRLSEGIRVLLVDEFQDTDRTQVAIVRALVGEGLTDVKRADVKRADAKGTEDRGRLFFVGDYKQSIYRFRGAEPRVFRELREQTAPAGQLPLSKNFRSQPAVLDFINTLFGKVFGSDDYTPLHASRPQTALQPAVEFLWTSPPEKEDGSKVAVCDERMVEARAIAKRIRAMLSDGEPLVADGDTPRPARLGDFALLFRALSDSAIYEEALREAGLDYYLVGGHAFYAQQEVFDVVNLLRSVDSVCDDIALAGVLRSPMFSLRDETLFWLTRKSSLNGGLFHGRLPVELSPEELQKAEHARNVLRRLRISKERLSTADLLGQALEETAYDAVLLAEFLGERKLANLEKLIEQARKSDSGGGNLHSYLRQLSEFTNRPPKESLAATNPADADVIRLMTVHYSKGLEFPIVVLPDLNRKASENRDQSAFHPELGPLVSPPRTADKKAAVGLDLYKSMDSAQEKEEQKRLFYVACTRAADRLILSSCLADPGDIEKLKGPCLKMLASRFDLLSGATLPSEEEKITSEPLVIVVLENTCATKSSSNSTTRQESKRVDLGRVLDKAEMLTKKTALPVADVGPIAVDPKEVFTFSVSRLTGQLRRPSLATEVLRESGESSKIDPLALGTLTHAVIERLDPQATAEQQPSAIRHWCDALAPQHARRHAQETASTAQKMIERFVASDLWGQMAGSERFEREVEFLLAWPPRESSKKPSAMLQGYIDALYLEEGGSWRIVDYKTNQVSAAQVPGAAEHYRLQLAVYALAVEQALGIRPASLTLCFLRPEVEQEFPWGPTERTNAIEQINEAIADARELEKSDFYD